MTDAQILKLSEQNQDRAHKIIHETGIIDTWTRAGAEVHIVGSLATGLLMKHLDIDLHVYTPKLDIQSDFTIMSEIASVKGIKKIEYNNLSDTDEACIEWHAWYTDTADDMWQIDIIHILKGSRYDGFFEQTASLIKNALTSDTRLAILKLKYNTPEDVHISGIEYCQAVIQGGVRTWSEFTEWRSRNPFNGIIEWQP